MRFQPLQPDLSTFSRAKALYVYALQENVMSQYDIIAQVNELLERNLNSFEIAHRLCLDLNQVQQIIATSIT